MEAFYRQDDERTFRPTDLTRGPWGPEAQHGGPPAALLGRAIEAAGSAEMQVARITFEILRPVPVQALNLSVRVSRPGKRVQMLEAEITVRGESVMRASAWQIRTDALELEGIHTAERPTLGPEAGTESEYFPIWTGESYLSAMEWRFVAGSFGEPGPATAWARMRHPLLPGEEPSPLIRVLIAADSGSGISSALDFRRWLFINPDLTVYLHRMPEGEWIALEASTGIEPNGIGLATTVISDERGAIGRGLQSLYVAER